LPEEPTPRELADEILRVLNDSDHRRQLGDGALRYARTWSFDRMTEHLLEIIDITRTARTEQWVRQLQTA
jgi:glycosyltransferase involved in cell wall biosynthesis